VKSPKEVCDALDICVAIAHALPWDKIGAVIAALALAYGVAMSVAFALYVYKFRGQRMARRNGKRA